MRAGHRLPAARVALVAAAFAAVTPAAAGEGPGVEARVVEFRPASFTAAYPVVDLVTGARSEAKWRVVQRTGNCCENYVTTTPEGRLLDLGGTYVNFTDDRGLTWKQVQPLEPLVNGEGTIALAPGGDIVGVEWDPYSGDHLLSFKYEAATGKWLYSEMLLHTPFFDREWLAVVPGPVTVLDETVPYVVFVRGGYPSKELWLYSTDGLTYVEASSTFVDQTVTGTKIGWLAPERGGRMDWIQPNTNAGITPIAPGTALAAPDFFVERWALLDAETLRWSGFSFPNGDLGGRYQVDSAGRLHNLRPKQEKFVYQISPDGGRSWASTTVELPPKHVIEEIDFRANLEAGVAAVAIHTHDNAAQTDRDLLYKLDIRSDSPVPLRLYEVGLGDVDGGRGVGASIRFDFETVAIFADGRVAMSFYDSTSGSSSTRVAPALAIEL